MIRRGRETWTSLSLRGEDILEPREEPRATP